MSCTTESGDVLANETAVSTTLQQLDINRKITENTNSDETDSTKTKGRKLLKQLRKTWYYCRIHKNVKESGNFNNYLS